ncbi:MAG: HAMP domain-containing histidine kinase [Bryobacteraceae bacterium]|nr:HAMP domain-containing histidine kinase [Bryobacteraceae bacterium]
MSRLGITGKLVFGLALILAGLGTALTTQAVSQFGQFLRQQATERLEAQALNWIEANYWQMVVIGDQPTLSRLVRDLQVKSSVSYVILANSEGAVRAAIGVPAGLSQAVSRRGDFMGRRWTEVRDGAGVEYFELEMSIPSTGTGMSSDLESMFGLASQARPERLPQAAHLGWLRIGVDRRDFNSRLQVVVRNNALLAAGLVGLAVLASFFFARRTVQPIAEMGKAATSIAGGDLSLRVYRGVNHSDEVGDLVRNFNAMAARLEHNSYEMARFRAGLEQMVEERTRALEQAKRQLEERTLALQEANSKLEERDRAKSDYISTVSHELRTPLTSIKAHAELLMDSPDPSPPELERRLAIINESTDRLTRLIGDILDLRRIESGVELWKTADADLRPIVRGAAELLAPKANEKGICLSVSTPDEIWARVDADQVQRVITNLIGNAIQFCSRGDVIEVSLARAASAGPFGNREGNFALIRVADTGPGIPADEHARIFEPFQQAKKAPSVAAGAGLGLTISREIVLHHHGEIWVESQPGCGSSFQFTLPLTRRPAFAAAAQA